VQEDSLFGGIASDVSALITENCFEFLDAPVKRIASLETPIPFQSDLEQQYLGKSNLTQAIQDLQNY
jgi:2-oxoisovalerate dehydrogenase E1 component